MFLWNLYPPFLGSGIRITGVDPGYKKIRVLMKLRWWNRNYVGTQYGGSLYSMCDPFYMTTLLFRLGKDYIVWDKAASIRFKKPGRGTVYAEFAIADELVEELRRAADTQGKVEHTFTALVTDKEGNTIAEVDKLLHIRKKDR